MERGNRRRRVATFASILLITSLFAVPDLYRDLLNSTVSPEVCAFGDSLTTLLGQLTGEDGPLNSRTEGINRSISDISDRREVLNRRLASSEARLRAQCTALDSLVSGLLATSTYLEQQLANLPKITNQNN